MCESDREKGPTMHIYLILIQRQDILAELFGDVLIPEAVRRELSSPAAPRTVTAWIGEPPAWLESRSVSSVPADLQHLGSGEREAIALALTEKVSVVLLDERPAAVHHVPRVAALAAGVPRRPGTRGRARSTSQLAAHVRQRHTAEKGQQHCFTMADG